jgi:NAD kinase
LEKPRPAVVLDERNPEALRLAQPFLEIVDGQSPNCIVVVGGDGVMLQALRQYWKLRLPFFGINAGHRGYLLNDRSEATGLDFLTRPAKARLLPLLYVEVETADGGHRGLHAVNDTWVERASGQAAWVEVKVNGQVRLPKLVADGALLATAHGSNAYARAMGARPLSVDARELLLVGSNASEPVGWKSAPLSLDSTVEFRVLDPEKRPIRAFVDGVEAGVVTGMKARVSRIAAVELVFTQERDIAAKLSEHFFPVV